MAKYEEPELTEPVDLCRPDGTLNPGAVGWSRRPLHNCNLKGRWPRKKKWSYWCVTSPEFAFSVTLANVDYLGLAAFYFLDFQKKELLEKTVSMPFGAGIRMGRFVEEDVRFSLGKTSMSFEYKPDGRILLKARMPNVQGKKLDAEIELTPTPGHETLNVVIPWGERTFQFTSKQNTLPACGTIRLGDRKYELDPANSFGCLDFGRGVWPYKTIWNWSSGSGWVGGDLIGLQFGGKWTDGTGMNENALCVNGKLFKINEDVIFSYDRKNWLVPWTIKTEATDPVDLIFKPFYDKQTHVNAGILKISTHQLFGRFSGVIGAEGRVIEISNIVGWAEESVSRW